MDIDALPIYSNLRYHSQMKSRQNMLSLESTLQSTRSYNRRTLALVYDFDGTLSPQSMQEYTVFPELKIDPSLFWPKVKEETIRNEATEVLTYMRLMSEAILNHNLPIKKETFQSWGARIPFFPGVNDWFGLVNEYVKRATHGYISVNHYIVSSGLREIILGTSISDNFKNIFASQYHWDPYGRPTFVDRVITDVSKTQYLFRINKGVEELHLSVNEHMPEYKRPIPFDNMLYFGDGDTDVPSMTVVRKSGGYAIAVHKPDHQNEIRKCRDLYKADRIDFFSIADYRHNSPLWIYTRTVLDRMLSNLKYQVTRHIFENKIVDRID